MRRGETKRDHVPESSGSVTASEHAAHGRPAAGRGHRQVAELAPALRIMTYNVRYFGHATRGIASTVETQ